MYEIPDINKNRKDVNFTSSVMRIVLFVKYVYDSKVLCM